MRAPRARRMRQQSNYMHDICQLIDGPAQIERDRVFREEQPGEGFPNPWADPGFQRWMWDFDAKATAERALTILNGASEKKRAYEEGEDVEVRKKIIKN